MSGRRSALIVATQRYADPGLSALAATDADARALTEVLGDPEIGDFDVTPLVDASAFEVGKAVAGFFSNRRADDLLLLHFSCHGVKDDSGELYFAATDTQLDLLDGTGVASSFVNRVMNRSRAGRVLLTLDCCYAGAFGQGLTARAAQTVDLGDRLGGRGRAIIAASSALQFAFEGQQPDDRSLGSPSLFTHALVEGLRSGDADRDLDGRVSLDELYAYIHDEVTRVNPDQTPKKWALDIEGDLYVARRARPVSTPSELPEVLRRTMGSLVPYERVSVMEPLRHLALGEHPGLALAARLALKRMADQDDSVQVRRAATGALDGVLPLGSPPAIPAPRFPSAGRQADDPDQTVVLPVARTLPASTSALADDVPLLAGAAASPPRPAHVHRRRVTAAVGAGTLILASTGAMWWLRREGDQLPPAPAPVSLPSSSMVLMQSNGAPNRLVSYDTRQEGGDLTTVIDDPTASMPTLSPDRQKIVFLAGARPQAPYVAMVDGSVSEPLLRDRAASRCPSSGRPAWSPSGQDLALICMAEGASHLNIVRADGTRLVELPAIRPVGAATWQDGNTIVYESAGPSASEPHVLRTVRRVGEFASRLIATTVAGSLTQPDVTVGGLVFLRKSAPDSPNGDVWFRSKDGSELPLSSGNDSSWPSASPDGQSVVWLQGEPGAQVLVRRSVSGGDATTLQFDGTPGPPAWGSR